MPPLYIGGSPYKDVEHVVLQNFIQPLFYFSNHGWLAPELESLFIASEANNCKVLGGGKADDDFAWETTKLALKVL